LFLRISVGLLAICCLLLSVPDAMAVEAPATAPTTAPASGPLFERGLTLAEVQQTLSETYAKVRATAVAAAKQRYVQTASTLTLLDGPKESALESLQEADKVRKKVAELELRVANAAAAGLDAPKLKQTKRRNLVLSEYGRFTRVAERIVTEVQQAATEVLKETFDKHDGATVEAIKRAAARAAFNTARKAYDETEAKALDGFGVARGDDRWEQKQALVTIRDGLPTLVDSYDEAGRVMAALDEDTDMPLVTAVERREKCKEKLDELRAAQVASASEGANKVSKLAQDFQDLSLLLTVIEDRLREREIFGIVVLLSLVVLFAALVGYHNLGSARVDSDEADTVSDEGAEAPAPGDGEQAAGTQE